MRVCVGGGRRGGDHWPPPAHPQYCSAPPPSLRLLLPARSFTEMLFTGILGPLSPAECAALLSALVFQVRACQGVLLSSVQSGASAP